MVEVTEEVAQEVEKEVAQEVMEEVAEGMAEEMMEMMNELKGELKEEATEEATEDATEEATEEMTEEVTKEMAGKAKLTLMMGMAARAGAAGRLENTSLLRPKYWEAAPQSTLYSLGEWLQFHSLHLEIQVGPLEATETGHCWVFCLVHWLKCNFVFTRPVEP